MSKRYNDLTPEYKLEVLTFLSTSSVYKTCRKFNLTTYMVGRIVDGAEHTKKAEVVEKSVYEDPEDDEEDDEEGIDESFKQLNIDIHEKRRKEIIQYSRYNSKKDTMKKFDISSKQLKEFTHL